MMTRSLDPVRNADVFVLQSLHGGPTESANDKRRRHESQASSVVRREPQISAGEPRHFCDVRGLGSSK